MNTSYPENIGIALKCDKLFIFLSYLSNALHDPPPSPDQVCSTLCTVCLQFRVSLVTGIDLLFNARGRRCTVSYTGMYKVDFPKVSKWHWKQPPSNHGVRALRWPLGRPGLSGSVSKNHSKRAGAAFRKSWHKHPLQHKKTLPPTPPALVSASQCHMLLH